jgi:hypothetical protein
MQGQGQYLVHWLVHYHVAGDQGQKVVSVDVEYVQGHHL